MPRSARAISDDLRRKIYTGDWPADYLLPGEEHLAKTYNVSRMTMNKAVMALVEEGLLTRKKKAGTRVIAPAAKPATFDLPLARAWIEGQGLIYAYRLLDRRETMAEGGLADRLGVAEYDQVLYLRCLHLGNNRVMQCEERWFNPAALPDCMEESFYSTSPGDWLRRYYPVTNGKQALSAAAADQVLARQMSLTTGAALLVQERRDFVFDTALSHSRVYYPASRLMLQEDGF